MRLNLAAILCLRRMSPCRPVLMTSWKSVRTNAPALLRLKSTLRPKGKRKAESKSISVISEPLIGTTPEVITGASVLPKTLPLPSSEQQVAIDTLLHTNDNLIIDAIAGSGKTTTILHLAQSAPDTKFLVLVYNRRLMLETDERVQGLILGNVTVLNYHTLGTRYYTPECGTDQGLKRVVEDDMPIIESMELPDFSVLVMDEQQDMTPILKRFVDKLIRDKGFVGKDRRPVDKENQLRVVVLGDKRQELYSFNNADSRFLTMAAHPEVFGYINDHRWVSATQTTSNRVTQQNVDFINQQMLKQPKGREMRAVRNNRDGVPFPRPRYVVCDSKTDVLDEVLRLLEICNVEPTDVIVLAPTVRAKSAAIYLANGLALRKIPVFRSDSDVSDIAPEVAHGKVLICTYHQAKGIERKASVVLGFDEGYHTWYNKVADVPTAVSNPQYVAATRALEHLVLIHDYKSPPLPFVDMETLDQSCDLRITRQFAIKATKPKPLEFPVYKVTALCRNLSENLITDCLRRLEFRMLAEPAYGVQPPPTEVEDIYGLLEGVSAITGTAVPAIFQWRQRKKISLATGPVKLLSLPKRKLANPNPARELPQIYYEKLGQIQAAHGSGLLTTENILYLATIDMIAKDGDITKLLALPIDGYDWLTEAHCNDIQLTLNTLSGPAKISGRGIFFESNRHDTFKDITHGGGPMNPTQKSGMVLSGAMDISRPGKRDDDESTTTDKAVWEIKYTESLSPEHLIQTALYMLLLEKKPSAPCPSGFLVSARTGHTVQVLPRTPGALLEVLQLLVEAKSGGEQTRLLNTYSDEEFLEECRRDFSGLIGKCALPAWFAMRPSRSKFKKGKPERRRNVVEGED